MAPPRHPTALPQPLPRPLRGALVGALVLGVLGCVAGLVVGMLVYPPTAWAATVELGIPSALVGAALGTLVGWLGGRHRHRGAGPSPR